MENSKFDLSNRLYILIAICFSLVTITVLLIGWKSLNKGTEFYQISVIGEASVTMKPDVVYIDLAVRTEDISSAEAINKNMVSMETVVQAIQGLGIEETDFQTQNFTVNPKYEWQKENYVEVGYEALQNITITLHNFELVDDVITAASQAGANQFNSVNFALEDYEDKLDEAREEAITEAREKAEVIARASGFKLGELTNYYEYTNEYMLYDGKGMGGSEGGVSTSSGILAGQEEITITVNLIYHIK